MYAKHKISSTYVHTLVGSCKRQNSRRTIRVFPAFKRLAAQYNNAKELKKSQYFQPVPDFEMTITPLNSKFSAGFDEVSGISRHFYEAQTLNLLRVSTLSSRVKQPSISNFFETSQPLRKIKQLTSFLVKK